MSAKRRLNRRDFLRMMAGAVGGTLLASCAPKVVKETVVVEKPIEKVIKETVIVEGTPQVVEKVVTATPKPAAKEITLVFPNHWHVPMDAHYSALEWVFPMFEALNPNIKIDSQPNPDKPEMLKKIQADCAAGKCPDLLIEVRLDHWDSGFVLDLAPYMSDEWKARFIPSVLDMCSWEGHIFGLPFEYSPIDTIWNMKVLDKVDMDVPKTWDEFMNLGEALKSQGLYLGTFAFGFDYHAPSAITFSQPGAAEAMGKEQWNNEYVLYAFEKMKEIVDKGYNPPNDLELDWRTAIPLWQTSQMAMYMNGAWTIKNEITADGVDPELRNNVVFTPFPDAGYGRSIELKMTTAVGLGAHLKDQPERLEAALKFLDFWSSEEAALHFVTDAQSPMGVIIPEDKMETAKIQVPMLAAFLDAPNQADVVFTHGLPSKTLRARSWGLFVPGTQALLLGKSPEEALEIWAEEMSRS